MEGVSLLTVSLATTTAGAGSASGSVGIESPCPFASGGLEGVSLLTVSLATATGAGSADSGSVWLFSSAAHPSSGMSTSIEKQLVSCNCIKTNKKAMYRTHEYSKCAMHRYSISHTLGNTRICAQCGI